MVCPANNRQRLGVVSAYEPKRTCDLLSPAPETFINRFQRTGSPGVQAASLGGLSRSKSPKILLEGGCFEASTDRRKPPFSHTNTVNRISI